MDIPSSPQHLAVGEVHNAHKSAPLEMKKQSYASTILQKQSSPSNIDLFPVLINQGEPVIQFTKDEVNTFIKEEGLHQAVIIKFSYGRPDLSEVRRIFSSQFEIQGHCNIGHLEYRHLLVRFDLYNDYVHFLSKSTAYLKSKGDEYFFRTFPWSLEFNPKEETPMAVVWISFPGLPPNFFAKRSLMSIASAVGKPLAVDKATHDRSRPSAARVKVIIDLLINHPKKIKLQIVDRITGKTVEFYQQIVFDNLPKYCTYCKHQGHDIKSCRIKKEKSGPEVLTEVQLDSDQTGREIVKLDKLQGDARDFLNAKRSIQAYKESQQKVDHSGFDLTKLSKPTVQTAADVHVDNEVLQNVDEAQAGLVKLSEVVQNVVVDAQVIQNGVMDTQPVLDNEILKLNVEMRNSTNDMKDRNDCSDMENDTQQHYRSFKNSTVAPVESHDMAKLIGPADQESMQDPIDAVGMSADENDNGIDLMLSESSQKNDTEFSMPKSNNAQLAKGSYNLAQKSTENEALSITRKQSNVNDMGAAKLASTAEDSKMNNVSVITHTDAEPIAKPKGDIAHLCQNTYTVSLKQPVKDLAENSQQFLIKPSSELSNDPTLEPVNSTNPTVSDQGLPDQTQGNNSNVNLKTVSDHVSLTVDAPTVGTLDNIIPKNSIMPAPIPLSQPLNDLTGNENASGFFREQCSQQHTLNHSPMVNIATDNSVSFASCQTDQVVVNPIPTMLTAASKSPSQQENKLSIDLSLHNSTHSKTVEDNNSSNRNLSNETVTATKSLPELGSKLHFTADRPTIVRDETAQNTHCQETIKPSGDQSKTVAINKHLPMRDIVAKSKLWKDYRDYDDEESWVEGTADCFDSEDEDEDSAGEDYDDQVKSRRNISPGHRTILNHNAPIYLPIKTTKPADSVTVSPKSNSLPIISQNQSISHKSVIHVDKGHQQIVVSASQINFQNSQFLNDEKGRHIYEEGEEEEIIAHCRSQAARNGDLSPMHSNANKKAYERERGCDIRTGVEANTRKTLMRAAKQKQAMQQIGLKPTRSRTK